MKNRITYAVLLLVAGLSVLGLTQGCRTVAAFTGKEPTEEQAVTNEKRLAAIQADLNDLKEPASLVPFGSLTIAALSTLAAGILGKKTKDKADAIATLIRAIESKGDTLLKETIAAKSAGEGTSKTIAKAVAANT